jgi:cell division protein FtsL
MRLREKGAAERDYPEADHPGRFGNSRESEGAKRETPDGGKGLGMDITETIKQNNVPSEDKSAFSINLSTMIFVALVLMAVALLYVWSHVNMTKLEYQVAEEIGIKERLLEEQKKLKVEIATLKAPQRIEVIARNKLQMSYPERDQVILIK